MNRTFSRLLFPLFFVSFSLGTFQSAEAHPRSKLSARTEFFHLKKSSEWINYIQVGAYVEVVGTQFIGLQAAFNEQRTCLYGFSQAGFEDSGSFQVRSRFVCFDTDRFQLNMKKEWCDLGSKGCEIDPGGISIGIGNLNVVEPIGVQGPFPRPGSFLNSYPNILSVDVYAPLGFPIEFGDSLSR